MANQDVDESDLPKKQRLINAWIAVGPEGKTTDVSELTDSSRGYASDVRRALEGEGDEEIDFEEIEEAYHPQLVATYRSELGEEAVSGEWGFADRLEAPPAEPTQGEPQAPGGPEGAQPPTEPPGQPTAEPQQPPRQPGQQRTGGGQPGQPGGGAGQPPTAPGQPTPTRPRTQTQGGGMATRGQPVQQPTQPTGSQPAHQQQRQQLRQQLQSLDSSLNQQQQQAQNEINAVPPQSTAQSVAISKYNLIVEVRQSIRQLLQSMQ